MSDATLVANKTKVEMDLKSYTVISEQAEAWKRQFGAVKPMIDLVATSQKELLMELQNCGFPFYYNEKVYFDQVVDGLDRSKLAVIDLSSNTTEEYVASLSKYGISAIAVESLEDTEVYSKVLPTVHFILRVGATDAVYDSGCPASEVVHSLVAAQERGVNLSSLLFMCPTYKQAATIISLIRSLFNTSTVHLDSVYIIGEGIQELAKRSDSESLSSFSSLKELAEKVPILVDGSRFFIAPTYTIYTHIIGKKYKTNGSESRILYYTDNGVYCSFFNAHIADEVLTPVPVSVEQSLDDHREVFTSTIFGPTCDSIDNLGDSFALPELQIGDWLKYEGVGYRCSNYSARFNGFEDPDVIVV
ncbi:hypothetical protein WA171_002156 [Blastocystis sp. BT1]